VAVKKKQAARRVRAQSKGVAAAVAAPPPAPAKPRSQKWTAIFGILVVAALLVQGVMTFMSNKKKDVTLFFESQIAVHGEGMGEVSGCRNLAVNAVGDVAYVFSRAEESVLQTYTAGGKLIARYKPKKAGEELTNIFALAYAPDGTLWSCERGSGRVCHFSPDLKLLNSFKAPSADLPGIAVDPQGQVWVASYANKIYVFSPKGELIKEFVGTPKAPLVQAYRLTFDAGGNLLVLDCGRGQGKDPDVKIYSPDGKSLGVFMAKALPFNEFSCIGVDQGLVVLNDNGANGTDSQGILLFNYKGKVQARATLTSNQLSLRNVPGLAIGSKGHWALDLTPVGRGCDRFSYSSLAE
jgi:hypothetical protein